MYIESIRIEEGFLDGFELTLSSGFNVLIGARGTGKTSIIELIRFCLGAQSFTEAAGKLGQQHAVSVLAGGAVTLVLRDGEERLVVTRQADQEPPRSVPPLVATVLAQSEVEAVGAQARGRMHLLDRGRPQSAQASQEAAGIRAALESTTAEIRNVLNEVAEFELRLGSLKSAPEDLSNAIVEQDEVLKAAAATVEDRTALEQMQASGERTATQLTLYEATQRQVADFRNRTKDLLDSVVLIESWPPVAGPLDLLVDVREGVSKAARLIEETEKALDGSLASLDRLLADAHAAHEQTEARARELRRRLNEMEAGTGTLTKRVNALREQQAQLGMLSEQLSNRRSRLEVLWRKRDEQYRALEEVRARRLRERAAIVERLNRELKPTIRIRLEGGAQVSEFTAVIVAAMEGSGLHYNALAPILAREVSPLELIAWSEKGEFSRLAEATGIGAERAASVVAYLRRSDTASVISAPIEDEVVFELLDGVDYKPSDRLSIGQRCTVVLPLLLAQPGDVLLLDQPEDHLDNAYVTSTLVERLRARHAGQQIIVSSHNPNIPVLGNADQVTYLESDGRRGYVACSGALESQEVIAAITRVMEGGAEAFARRAAVYGDLIPGSGGSV